MNPMLSSDGARYSPPSGTAAHSAAVQMCKITEG
jgi:hypothetical protein